MARFGGQPVAVLIGFFIRVIASGLYSHILWTGLTGMGVGYFVSRVGEASRVKRVAVAGALFLTAVAGHLLWDSPVLDLFPRSVTTATDLLQGVWAAAVKGLPLLGVVAGMVILARRREHRWLRTALTTSWATRGSSRRRWRPWPRRAASRRSRSTWPWWPPEWMRITRTC